LYERNWRGKKAAVYPGREATPGQYPDVALFLAVNIHWAGE
jgi:hypothetical protein